MRILKITQAYYPFLDRGGPAIKVRSIARSLVQLGHQVTVLTADLGFGPRELEMSAAVRDPQGWCSQADGLEAIYLGTCCSYRNLTINPGVVAFCRQRLREFDLVHIYGLYDTLGPVVAHYCREFRIPYLVEPLGMTRPIDRGFLLKKIWKGVTNGYLSNATRMIATSEQESEELLGDGFSPNQVLLRYNGINLEEFRHLPPAGAFRKKLGLCDHERFIVFLGRVIPRKGADLLIEALSQFGDDSLKLVVAGPEGEQGYVGALHEKAHSLGIKERVLFTGALYGDDKKAALADAAVFALPSRYENFGNTAAEAIACGTPAIVSDQCGIAPLVRQRAGLVTTYDADSIARTLKELLYDEGLYRRLKMGCAEVSEEISWGKLVPGMYHSYEQATNQFLR